MAHVICIGNPNIDAVSYVDDAFLQLWSLPKDSSKRVDQATLLRLLASRDDFIFLPGGCAANTACGLAALNIPVTFAGKAGQDKFGEQFAQDFLRFGVQYKTPPHPENMTSLCLTFITPDKDRTFAYSTETSSRFISADELPAPQGPDDLVYLEAYLLQAGGEGGQDTMLQQAIAKYKGHATLALNLNDKYLFADGRAAPLILPHMDVIIGNKKEFEFFMGTPEDFPAGLALARAAGPVFVITDEYRPVTYVSEGHITIVPVPPLRTPIADTVGAGDQFAAGWIAAFLQKKSWQECCDAGIREAAKILSRSGARPPPDSGALR